MSVIVIALGGNSMVKPGQKGTFKQQLRNINLSTKHIAKLVLKGEKIVITHGNGFQVGNILMQQTLNPMPLHVCVAESQGMIGYLIQESLYNHLHEKKNIPVVTVLTQVLVDPKDPAFRKPSKPVGPSYRNKKRGVRMVRTKKGWRKVVASPKPVKIIEDREIRKMVMEAVVIACGGGGIPVVDKRGLVGVDAVIDKDLAGAELARIVKAKTFVILTDVDGVYVNYKKKGQKLLRKLGPKKAKNLLKRGEFPPGSMGPKIEAALNFLKQGDRVLVCRFDKLGEALRGRAGTEITY